MLLSDMLLFHSQTDNQRYLLQPQNKLQRASLETEIICVFKHRLDKLMFQKLCRITQSSRAHRAESVSISVKCPNLDGALVVHYRQLSKTPCTQHHCCFASINTIKMYPLHLSNRTKMCLEFRKMHHSKNLHGTWGGKCSSIRPTAINIWMDTEL